MKDEMKAINLWLKENPKKAPSRWFGVALDKQQRYRERAEQESNEIGTDHP